MSAETVARWNAIPFNRPDPDQSAQPSSLKRTRPDADGDGDESEDNVSLVSRSPSPLPPDAMDIDKYDEYYGRKPEREVITVETKIKSSNVGFSMLAKMGWVEGKPLGLSGDGRVEPIPFYVKNDLTGLGKANQDVRMIETTVSQRRELSSERQIKETEEQRKQREEAVARRAAVQSELSSVLRPFYCEVCEKQFQNVAQYDEHTNSYAHHHKVRFRDMQAAQRASRNTQEEVDRRKEKERKREEKELRKIAKAAGVKMTKPPVALAPVAEPSAEPKPAGFKKSGWATVTSATPEATAPSPSAEPPKRSGWATVGEAQQASSSSSSRGGWAPAVPPSGPAPPSSAPPPPTPAPAARSDYSTAPAFRTGGWTSLETGGSVPPPAPPAPSHYTPPAASSHYAPPPPIVHVQAHPAPPAPEARGGWANSRIPPSSGGWRSSPPHAAPPPPVPPPSFGAPPPPLPANYGAPPPAAPPFPDSRPPAPSQSAPKEASRSGWQKFRAGAPGRRR